jgi:FkbM family methyltransferase
MKKILLDCGTHFGQGLDEISNILGVDNTWEIHSWEANPYTFEKFNKRHYPANFHFYNAAISNTDGIIKLNVETVEAGDYGQGSSIVEKNKWINPMHKGEFLKTVEVSCVDLSTWVNTHCSQDDFVAIKLDIEGAEYDVLEKMIADGTAYMVDHFFIEWHARFFPNKEQIWEQQARLTKTLQDKNIKITRWK